MPDTMPDHPFGRTRHMGQAVRHGVALVGWPLRLGLSIGFAGFLALMGAVSFPVPWTPVPFSMMPFALLVTGGMQRPGYAALSVVLYLTAGALGAPIYAERAHGASYLVGSTAGYLYGFVLVSTLVAAYMRRPRRALPRPVRTALTVLVSLSIFGGLAVIVWMTRTGTGLEEDWGVGRSTVWVLSFLVLVSLALTAWLLRARRGHTQGAGDLFFVMLGSLLVLHACGVTVLWLTTDLMLIQAIALGSVVFLPFDIIKAGLAVGLTLPFLPEKPMETTSHA